MRLERDNHVILRAEIRRIIGRGDLGHAFVLADQEFQSVLPDRRQMRAARDQRNLDTVHLGEFRTEIAPDRARAIDTNFHAPTLVFFTRLMKTAPTSTSRRRLLFGVG